MKRPNRIDWLIYRIFRWWWNPILRDNPHIGYGLSHEILKYLRKKSTPGSWEKARRELEEFDRLQNSEPDPLA